MLDPILKLTLRLLCLCMNLMETCPLLYLQSKYTYFRFIHELVNGVNALPISVLSV